MAQRQTTGCPSVTTTIGGGAVNLGGSQTAPGTPNRGRSNSTGGGGASTPTTLGPKCMTGSGTCTTPATPAAGAVTLNDIASFRPMTPVDHMEPNGWMVVGLDANFYAAIDQHVVDGTLLGQPASVRFTPVTFRWVYGDGAAATRSTKGSTWAGQGIPEFDPTPTSHVYETAGEFTIQLVVGYAAEYQFAGAGFVPIAGVLPVPANDLHVSVGSAKTVLVEHDCGADPGGPGC